jgi:hypothetical protein
MKRLTARLLTASAALLIVAAASGQTPLVNRDALVAKLRSKIMAGDPHEHDCFGRSLAMTSKYIIAGAKGDDTGAKDSGAAYVFEERNGDYVQLAKLKADRPHINDYFGFSVAIDGDTAVVGAWQDKDKGVDTGAVYVFARQGDSWPLQAKLTADDASDFAHFGYAVGISGDRIVVGAREDQHRAPSAGAAYVFIRNGDRWIQEARLDASAAIRKQQFGWSVAIDADRVLIGAIGDKVGSVDSGAAYVFARTYSGWELIDRLAPPDPKKEQRFGYAVSLQGNAAVVGAYRDSAGGYEAGAAYVYEANRGRWSAGVKVLPSDSRASQYFGWSVAIDGDRLAVGAWYDGDGSADPLGSVYVFHKSGKRWVEEKKLIANERTPMHLFGWAVAVSGSTVSVGARLDDEAAKQAGAVYLYKTKPAANTNF